MKLGLMAVGLAFLALVGLPAVASDRPSYAFDDTWSSIAPDVLEKSVALLSHDMADPASIRLRLLAPMKDGGQGLCGEADSKNAYGGDVGFLPFIVSLARGSAEILPAKQNTPDGIKAIRARMEDACPQWSEYAGWEARIEAAVADDPDVATDSVSMIVNNFCNYTADTAEDYHRCTRAQTKAERRIAAIVNDPVHHDVAEALYETCYDATAGIVGSSFKNTYAMYECMIGPGSPFEVKMP